MNLSRSTLADEWRGLRMLVLSGGLVLLVLAASGTLNTALFVEPSTIKYVVTVAGAGLLIVLATVRAPLKLLAGLAIVVAPFDFVTTVTGLQVTPLIAVEVLAIFVALPRSARVKGAVRTAAAMFALLTAPAIAISNSPGQWLVWLALTIGAGWVTYLVALEPGGPPFVAMMLAVSALIQAGLAIWEFRAGHQLNLYTSSGSSAVAGNFFFKYGTLTRPSGALPDPIGLGQVLALCVPLMVALSASRRKTLPSLGMMCAAGACTLALVLSLSRASILGGVFGVIIALLLLPPGSRTRAWSKVGAVAVIVVLIGLSLGGPQLTKRIDSIFHPTVAHLSTAQGDLERIRIWQAAIKTGEANWVAGVGFGNITRYLPLYGVPVATAGHAHQTYLQFFAEGGVLALLALVGVLVASLRDLVRAFATERIWVAGAAGGLIATIVAWSTDVEIRYVQVSSMVAVMLGLIAALAARAQDPDVARRSRPAIT